MWKISIANLNQANNQFKIYYSADFDYLLSITNSRFLVKSRFCIKSNNNIDANSIRTFASNYFGYLFDDIFLKLNGKVIESIYSPWVILDVFYNKMNIEFRKIFAKLCRYISNTNLEISDTIGTRLGNVEGANAPAVIASINNYN